MSSVIVEQEFPYDIIRRGARDARRHNKRVRDAVQKQLKSVISSEDIITSQGDKKVKVRLKGLDSFRFRHFPDRVDTVGRDEFDDLEEGEIISKPSPGSIGEGKPNIAGNEAGAELYEIDFTIDELTEMMVKHLRLPLLDEKAKSEIVAEVIEWTDRRKQGVRSLIDKKHTLLANIKRSAKSKSGELLPIINDDLRYRSWQANTEKHSNAVVFLMLDRSASMWEDKIYAVKAFYFWVVQFLRLKYRHVEIKFIAHDVDAKELEEKEFFTISDSGGTKASSAYEMSRDIIIHNYPSDIWNIYCFHASDGDTWGDEDYCCDLIREMLKFGIKLFAYVEVGIDDPREGSSLQERIQQIHDENDRCLLTRIRELDDILAAIEYIFMVREYVKS